MSIVLQDMDKGYQSLMLAAQHSKHSKPEAVLCFLPQGDFQFAGWEYQALRKTKPAVGNRSFAKGIPEILKIFRQTARSAARLRPAHTGQRMGSIPVEEVQRYHGWPERSARFWLL
jgi:hypothetical protein